MRVLQEFSDHVCKLVIRVDKVSDDFSRDHLSSCKMRINFCVWFAHGRLGLMQGDWQFRCYILVEYFIYLQILVDGEVA